MYLVNRPVKTVIFIILFQLLLSAFLAGNSQSDTDALLQRGMDAFQTGRYEVAENLFLEIISNEQHHMRLADAYFWTSKTYMALGALGSASSYLEYFIYNFPQHHYTEEAYYQRGRIFYLQADYNNAIQSFSQFADEFPESAFIPNAFYWNAESLFQMGQLTEARKIFQIVVKDYPTSYRSEAAAYRLSVIDLYEREAILLDLLAASHQELLYTIDYYEQRERQYIEVIDSQARQLQGHQ
ncbi:tetratricopeptide repeat protein [Spirochaeta dissipatitropha]